MAAKKIRVLWIVVVAVVVVCAAGAVALHLLFPPEKIKAMVIPQVEKALGRHVTIEKAGISVFPSIGADLKGLSISETQRPGFDSTAFLSVGELEVRVGLMALLKRSIDITKIVIDRPYIRVQVDTSGAFNYDDLALLAKKDTTAAKPKPGSKGVVLPLPLSLRSLTISNGAVEYINAQSRQSVAIGAINERLSMSADRAMENVTSTGELSLSGIVLKTKEIAKPIRDLTFTLRHDVAVNLAQGSAAIKSVRLSLEDVYVNVSGTVKNLQASPLYDLIVTTDTMALEKLIAAIPADLVPSLGGAKGSGNLYLKVSANGGTDPANPPVVVGRLNVWNGVIQYPGLPESIRDMRANIDFTTDKVVVSPLSLKLGNNPIDIVATVEHFAKPLLDAKVDATVNLGELKNIVKLPPGNTLGGVVKAAIAAKGLVDPSDPAKLDVRGAVQLNRVQVQTPALTKPAVFNGQVKLTSRQISPAITLDIASSKISLNANVANYLSMVLPDSTKRQPRPKADFRIASSSLNTNEFLPQNTASAEKGTKPAPAATQVPPLLLPAPLPGIDVSGSITTGRLTYQDFQLTNLSMKYSMVNDRMSVTTRTGVFDGTLAQTISVDATDIRDLKVKSSLKIDNVEISRMLSSTKKWLGDETKLNRELQKLDKHVYGKSNTAIDLVTHGGTMPELTKNLDATLVSRLANGRITAGDFVGRISVPLKKLKILDLNDIAFREMKLNARIKDEKVYLDDVSIGSPSTGDWKAAGIVGFNGSMGVDLTNRLPVGLSRALSKGKTALTSAAKGALEKTPLAQAAGLVDNLGPRPDSEGRYIIRTKLSGLLPSFSVDAFQFVDGGGAAKQQAPSPKQQIQEQVKQKVEQVKEQAKEAVQKQAQQVQKQAEQVQKQATTEAKKTVETGKKKAMDALKKKF